MGELALRDRLQPSLLDRLTDDSPEDPIDTGEGRAISEVTLRELVRRDLSWLLNSTNLAAVQDLRAFPEASRSVINYGIQDLSGKTLSSVDPRALAQTIREAILNYEPRLLRRSIKVHVVPSNEAGRRNALVVDIEAELWSQPLPVALYLWTEIDLESGAVRVEEGARSSRGES